MSALDSRYAEALLSLALSGEEADGIGDLLSSFSAVLSENDALRAFLFNPVIAGQVRKETIRKIVEDPVDATGGAEGAGTVPASPDAPAHRVSQFLQLLTDKSRLSILPDIAARYLELKAAYREVLRITVYSSVALDEAQLKAIRSKYAGRYGAQTAEIENRIDPKVLGGICVQIGDLRIDDTAAGRLNALRRVLIRQQES